MVTRPALRELRPVIAEFAISAAVSQLFTILTSTTVRHEELSDDLRRAERVSGRPMIALGQVLRAAGPSVTAVGSGDGIEIRQPLLPSPRAPATVQIQHRTGGMEGRQMDQIG